jgi:asparaginyl-tRNA synthetase
MLTIKQILTQPKLFCQKTLKVSGWVQSVRQNKFIQIKDGSTLKTLQLVGSPNLTTPLKKMLKFGSHLQVQGQLILTPHQAQSCELKIEKIISLQTPDPDYPFQKQRIPLAIVRNYPHLRTKTNYFLALFRLRHSISKAIHDFFDQESFYYVPTPIITSNDAEGAGETFNLITKDQKSFFSKPAQLTVSGQLQAEALAQGLGQVYTFSPCFRAEKSHTTRHLAEFWMIEAELTPITNLKEVVKFTERLIKFIINSVLEKQTAELEYLEKYSEKEIISRLKKIKAEKFAWLDYTEAIEILKESKEKFGFSDLSWGQDLKSEHEKYLCKQQGDKPIFILNYPRDLKAFYMKEARGGKTVECFDLIFPQIGELVGGSIRESDYEVLKSKAEKVGIDTQGLAWYLDLRRFGYAPSGGFGLGLERLIMLISGTENIQDTLAFPVFHQHLEF